MFCTPCLAVFPTYFSQLDLSMVNLEVTVEAENGIFQWRHNYVIITYCRMYWWDILQFFSHTDVRMIRAKNCEKFSKFIKVTANILWVPFFPDMMCMRSSSSDRVDSRGPLRQPGVATTTSLRPFSTNAEGCTIANLLDPWMARASWLSPPTRTKPVASSCCCDLW